MLKKLALVLILLVPAFASQAFSASFDSITNVRSFYGTCDDNDLIMIDMNATFAGNVDDGGDADRYTIVLYDGNNTAIGLFNASYTVGASAGISSIYLPTIAWAQYRPFTLKLFDTTSFQAAAGAANYPLVASITFDPATYGTCAFLPVYAAPVLVDDGGVPRFIDGRLNNFDMASPFVVFGHDFEDGRGLVVYSPEGALLLTVNPELFVAECTGETIELASENGVTLYLLASCEYQMMARSVDGTKNYVLIFNSPYPDTGYSSYEE